MIKFETETYTNMNKFQKMS